VADAEGLSNLRTLGPCPRCGRERLQRTEVESIPGLMGVLQGVITSCGACPTERTTFEPPDDHDAPILPY
jgi:hypothetical protein